MPNDHSPAMARNRVDLPAPEGPMTSVGSCGISARSPTWASLRPLGRLEVEVGNRQGRAGRGGDLHARLASPRRRCARSKESSNDDRRLIVAENAARPV